MKKTRFFIYTCARKSAGKDYYIGHVTEKRDKGSFEYIAIMTYNYYGKPEVIRKIYDDVPEAQIALDDMADDRGWRLTGENKDMPKFEYTPNKRVNRFVEVH